MWQPYREPLTTTLLRTVTIANDRARLIFPGALVLLAGLLATLLTLSGTRAAIKNGHRE